MVEFGVCLPVLNNGWIMSTAAPQYQPSYAMNRAMTRLAEELESREMPHSTELRGGAFQPLIESRPR